jgi:diaminobutyrate-2-oxoglutarate transaminase
MIGVEVIDTDGLPRRQGGYPPSAAMARLIQAEALRRGLILELGGRHSSVVRFLPLLIVSDAQISQIATIFREAVKAAEGGQ